VAIANLVSKKTATISGVAFMLALFIVFTISEWLTHRRKHEKGLEQFNLDTRPEVSNASTGARPGCVLVAVRDYNRFAHLETVLRKTNTQKEDIVVVTTRNVSSGAGEYDLGENQLFSEYEQELFTRVVAVAEKEGKTVELLVVPGVNPFDALVQTAARLQASRLVTGVSAKMDSEELARRIGKSWEKLPEPRHPFSLEIISPERPSIFVNLGPHPPRLWPEDVNTVHNMWLELSEHFGSKIHHRDVVGVALRRMARDLGSDSRATVMSDVTDELRHHEGDA
jgi:nucleotide-binding universal stress UspA family protein